jgi:Toprim domain
MAIKIDDLIQRLGENAEAVCRHYLPAGRREGAYWLVGDVQNTPGRSMFVRLIGPAFGAGAAGKWTDASSGEYGDLLDIIRERQGLTAFSDIVTEARSFLSLPPPASNLNARPAGPKPPSGSAQSARRLFAGSAPAQGSLVETYLRHRGITQIPGADTLRFHPRCYYRGRGSPDFEPRPAMIAAVTDLSGAISGVHRTWLADDGSQKAPVDPPRRAMGHLLGHAVRFGVAQDVSIAGEGIETMASLIEALPTLPMVAALSAGHLGAIQFPPMLRRLYIAQDRDPAGQGAATRLRTRAHDLGIEAVVLMPRLADFNDDLRHHGRAALRAALQDQLIAEDWARFASSG